MIAALVLVLSAAFFLDKKMSLRGVIKEDYAEEDESGAEQSLIFDETEYIVKNNIETFLFLGTDYSGNEDASGKDYEGSMADFILLMIVDHTEDTYAFLPLDRNTIVDVPLILEDGSGEASAEEQLCTAHGYGGNKEMGCENTVTAISDYLGGLTIDGYYSISMSEISAINHALGGVEVTLEDDFSDKDPTMTKGKTMTLNDEQAELFIHSRMNMKDDSNARRMARQKAYMSAALKKVKSRLKEDPKAINGIKDTFEEKSTSNITGKQSSRIINAFVKCEDLGIHEIKGKTKIGKTMKDGEEHEEFYPDEDSLLETMTILYHLEEAKE